MKDSHLVVSHQEQTHQRGVEHRLRDVARLSLQALLRDEGPTEGLARALRINAAGSRHSVCRGTSTRTEVSVHRTASWVRLVCSHRTRQISSHEGSAMNKGRTKKAQFPKIKHKIIPPEEKGFWALGIFDDDLRT